MGRFLLTWASAFLSVLVIFATLGPILATQPIWLRALVVSGLMVAFMQTIVAPFVARLLAGQGGSRA